MHAAEGAVVEDAHAAGRRARDVENPFDCHGCLPAGLEGAVLCEDGRDASVRPVTRWYLTPDAVTTLRAGLVLMMGGSTSLPAQVYREFVRSGPRPARASARLVLGDFEGSRAVITSHADSSGHVEDLSAAGTVARLAVLLSQGRPVFEHSTGDPGGRSAARLVAQLGGGAGAVEFRLKRPTAGVEEVRYARHTGAHGFGWARRVCEENPAAVRAALAAARRAGRGITVDESGVICVERGGIADPGQDGAGEECPVWFVPQRPAAAGPVQAAEARAQELGALRVRRSAPTADGHGYTWGDAREVLAAGLRPGDVFVKPGTGTAYWTAFDGTVRGAEIAHPMPMDGTAWTVTGRDGRTVTAVSHQGDTQTAEIPDRARVLRVAQAAQDTPLVLAREPWRGGQYCGHQIQYGMGAFSERYCGERRAPGLVECPTHHEQTLADYGPCAAGQAIAAGVAVGDPSAPGVLLWELLKGTEPVEPTGKEST